MNKTNKPAPSILRLQDVNLQWFTENFLADSATNQTEVSNDIFRTALGCSKIYWLMTEHAHVSLAFWEVLPKQLLRLVASNKCTTLLLPPLFLTLLPIYTSCVLVACYFKSYHIRKNEVHHVLCIRCFWEKKRALFALATAAQVICLNRRWKSSSIWLQI